MSSGSGLRDLRRAKARRVSVGGLGGGDGSARIVAGRSSLPLGAQTPRYVVDASSAGAGRLEGRVLSRPARGVRIRAGRRSAGLDRHGSVPGAGEAIEHDRPIGLAIAPKRLASLERDRAQREVRGEELLGLDQGDLERTEELA